MQNCNPGEMSLSISYHTLLVVHRPSKSKRVMIQEQIGTEVLNFESVNDLAISKVHMQSMNPFTPLGIINP